MSDVVLQEVTPPNTELLEQIGRLRVRAWATVVPEAAQVEVWLDEFDTAARHWVVTVNGELAAAARMSVHNAIDEVPEAEVYKGLITESLPTPIASINRLVVAAEYRQKGYARLLDRARINAARVSGYERIIAGTPSGPKRVRALKSIGFQSIGAAFGVIDFADGASQAVTFEALSLALKQTQPLDENLAHSTALIST